MHECRLKFFLLIFFNRSYNLRHKLTLSIDIDKNTLNQFITYVLYFACCRFKRLRTPSNYLVMSLATSDLGIGMFMPVGMYLELGGTENFTSTHVCLLSYGVAITLCCVSVLVMVAIAVDRFTSLARPLRYANLITHSAVERYIAVFWAYSSLVGFTPLGYALVQGVNNR